MVSLFPLDTCDPGDEGVACDAGVNHGMRGAAAMGASLAPEQGGFMTRAQTTESGSPISVDAAHILTPLQSLTSRPRRILGDERVLQPPFEVIGPHSSSSPSPSPHSPVSPGESGNPNDSF